MTKRKKKTFFVFVDRKYGRRWVTVQNVKKKILKYYIDTITNKSVAMCTPILQNCQTFPPSTNWCLRKGGLRPVL